MDVGDNWVAIRLSYDHKLVMPSKYATQLLEMLTHARVISDKDYGADKGAIMQDHVPGIEFVTNAYVAGAAARAKMLAENKE